MSNPLEMIGLTEAELAEKVVDKLVNQLLDSSGYESEIERRLHRHVASAVDAAVDKLAAEHILPNVHKYVEQLTLQRTNQWGEAQGKPVTFIEHLVDRAEVYLNEKVDHEGRSKSECNYHSWTGKQTRVVHLVDRHLQYSIEVAMKGALAQVSESLSKGIGSTVEEMIKDVIANVKASAKVEVKR